MRDTGEYQICAYFVNDKGVISTVARSRVTFLDAGGEAPEDRIPPTVAILDPFNNTAISGKIPIKVEANDNIALDRVQIYVDGVLMHDEMMVGSPYPIVYYFLDTTTYVNGACNITAIAYDHVGLKAQTTHEVEIKNESDNTTDDTGDDDDKPDDTADDFEIPGYQIRSLLFVSTVGIIYILSKKKKNLKKY
jgi:hypothetical protein